MNYISEGVYIGDVDDAYDTGKLRKDGVTHILTLNAKPLTKEATEGFVYKYVHAFDTTEEDLLSHMEECIQFMDEACKEGAVFVHCYAGRSRSATVVLAYLMRKFEMSLSDTLVMVNKQRAVSPNEGFMIQLGMFEKMGWKVDLQNAKYKVYKLKHMATKIQTAQITDAQLSENVSVDPASIKGPQDGIIYKCKKCRRALFKQTCILPHDEGIGTAAFTWKASSLTKDTSEVTETLCTQSLFIEPVQWMEVNLTEIEGKLSCPKCRAKLGSYNWAGERCPCGRWVTPAFHIQSAKVDRCLPQQILQGPPRLVTSSAVYKEEATNLSSNDQLKDMIPADRTIETTITKIPVTT